MEISDLDSPAAALQHLADPLRAIRDCLDDAVSFADSFMGLPENPYDAHMWAHLVRYRARNEVAKLGDDTWQLGRSLPNSGIEIACNPLLVRVLKTQGN